MPHPSIEEVRGLGDFATTYQWNLNIIKFPNVAGGNGEYPTLEGANLRCETTGLPTTTNEKVTAALRGHKKHQAGINGYEGTLEIAFVETVDNTIAKFIQAWREACAETKTGKHNVQADVEATIEIERLNRQDEHIWGYTLVGCFLESYDLGQMQGETSELFKPTLTVSYDYFDESLKEVTPYGFLRKH